MSLIRNVTLSMACAGLVLSAPMASARSTSGSVPAFAVSAQAPAATNVPEGTISDDGQYKFTKGKWHLLKNGRWVLLGVAASVLVGGIIILASNSR
ncbi:hypothetical protein OKA06_01510 [Novosphingobium sp. MW5]|nr:hypothetical protein [Novosphingobium sp. MW5]